MSKTVRSRISLWTIIALGCLAATGCTTTDQTAAALKSAKKEQKIVATQSGVTHINGVKTYTYSTKDVNCLERAMFFESNRSSPDGLIAVGTVVMNRLASPQYPDTICGVVGPKNQFAPGVLTRKMNSIALPDVQAAAAAVLKGQRHKGVKKSMFFHTAGLKFPYKNMHYTVVAGGNAFYEKRNRDGSLQNQLPNEPYNLAMIYTPHDKSMPDGETYNVTAPSVDTDKAEATSTMVAFADQQSQIPIPSLEPEAAPSSAQNMSLAFNTSDQQIDEIGALLLAQERPQALQ